MIALQALENNVITPDYTMYDPGYYKLKNDDRFYRGWRKEGHGLINLENAIAQSCGTYFYYVADSQVYFVYNYCNLLNNLIIYAYYSIIFIYLFITAFLFKTILSISQTNSANFLSPYSYLYLPYF